jgi:hypothetical protein
MAEFARFEEPSKKIFRFLEKYISKGKSDSVHNKTVSFENCMLSVPGSFNSKHNVCQVKIIQQWNGQRFSIKPLLGDFLAYLLDEKSNSEKFHYNKYNRSDLLSKR